MADEEGFSWVFESLVGFLKGPVWEAAVLTYIEKKSVGEFAAILRFKFIDCKNQLL